MNCVWFKFAVLDLSLLFLLGMLWSPYSRGHISLIHRGATHLLETSLTLSQAQKRHLKHITEHILVQCKHSLDNEFLAWNCNFELTPRIFIKKAVSVSTSPIYWPKINSCNNFHQTWYLHRHTKKETHLEGPIFCFHEGGGPQSITTKSQGGQSIHRLLHHPTHVFW